ncbi:MAG TPA: 2-phospho-L-lactate guanylyltransferase [Dehalococcoidia bacterium]|nr:2-phospho-L-lactate guanylyltransferase [Dehalococcoidia bacterium]
MRAALIPMKELSQAKLRLAPALDAAARAELALAMLADVIAACAESGCFDLIAVVSNDSTVFWHARELGATPIAEPAALGGGLNAGLTFAQRYLARRVAVSELVILPADVPLARADDIRAVVDALAAPPDRPRCVLVRSRDNGTNALALRPPEAVAPAYGRNSADAHRAAALAASIDLVELTLERLAFDVDAPDDLTELETLPAGPATRRFLAAPPASPPPRSSSPRPQPSSPAPQRGEGAGG